jgi:hypothetical protein
MKGRSAARLISIVGHPFVTVPSAIVVATWEADAVSKARILGAVLLGMLVLATYVVIRFRRGDFTDVDVSTREHRPGAFVVGILASGGSVLLLSASSSGPLAVRGAAVACALLIVTAVVNVRVKASLHVIFAVLAASIAWRSSRAAGVGFFAFALLVGWARVRYGRHTLREVAVGLALGSAGAFAYSSTLGSFDP